MDDDDEQDWICYGCVGDYYLVKKIKAEGERHKCTYCTKLRRCFSVSQVGDLVHPIFMTQLTHEEHESRGDSPMFWVATILSIDENEVATAILQYLSDTHDDYDSGSGIYDDSTYYRTEGSDGRAYAKKWGALRQSLLHESRYFNPTARKLLDEMFDGLNFALTDKAPAHLPPYMIGRSVVTVIGPGQEKTALYRAREARHQEQAALFLKDPVGQLGPPPPLIARAGRMNPSGVSLFYGAFEPDTCVPEIRAPVGTYVVIGRFEVLRPLRLLDFDKLTEAFEAIPHFHPNYDEKKDRDAFLEAFAFEIATPVHPQDEAVGYLPTQAVAEYLAQREDLKLDGLIYPSTQTGSTGSNVVLFRPASVVEPLVQVFDAAPWSYSNETASFSVTAKPIIPPTGVPLPVPPSDNPSVYDLAFDPAFPFGEEDAPPPRTPPTLRLDPAEITVRKVISVSYQHDDSRISRRKHTDKQEETDF